MNTVDAIDKKLISLLRKNSRQSSDTLGAQLGIDSSTVRRRIKRLVDKGVLSFYAHPNPAAIGFPVKAITGLDVEPRKMKLVMEALRNREEIRWIYPTSGRYDIMAMCWFSSNQAIYDFSESVIGKLEGVRNTETFICLNAPEEN
jgi:DNA-binding Lrp family transcriptional regulator